MSLNQSLCTRSKIALVALVIAASAVACSPAPPASLLYVNDTEYQQTWFPFLQDDKITKSEVELKLGKPSNEFESGRIWTYEMVGLWVVSGNPEYSLVLVFDDRNLLQKHSLVKIRHKRMSG